MAEIHFTKMHGLGNDYVYINCMESVPDNLDTLAIEMSDRHTGVGGDGIILILPSDKADCKMRIFNADGSEAMMCGNGIRCVAKYVHDKGIINGTHITVDTLSGVKTIDISLNPDGTMATATVDMGTPDLFAARIPVTCDTEEMVEAPVSTDAAGEIRITAVSMGNPHGVIFIDTLDNVPVHALGSELERHPMWPDRANIEMAERLGAHLVKMRVWERGSGETMACGTGACATAVASVRTGRCEWPVTVRLLGGELQIDCDPANGHIMMTGPATTVFEGTYYRTGPDRS